MNKVLLQRGLIVSVVLVVCMLVAYSVIQSDNSARSSSATKVPVIQVPPPPQEPAPVPVYQQLSSSDARSVIKGIELQQNLKQTLANKTLTDQIEKLDYQQALRNMELQKKSTEYHKDMQALGQVVTTNTQSHETVSNLGYTPIRGNSIGSKLTDKTLSSGAAGRTEVNQPAWQLLGFVQGNRAVIQLLQRRFILSKGDFIEGYQVEKVEPEPGRVELLSPQGGIAVLEMNLMGPRAVPMGSEQSSKADSVSGKK